MSKSSSLAKATFWITFSEIIFNVSAFIIHAVVGRILGPADYGRYGLIITLTTMVIILIGNGIPTAMSKYISEIFESNPRMIGVIKRKAIILQSVIIGVVTILFYFSAPLIAGALSDPTLTPLFRLSTLIIPAFAAASFYFSYFTGLHRFNLQATLKVTRSIFRFIFIISFAYFFHLEGSIIGYVAAPAGVFLIAYLIDKFKISRELRERENETYPTEIRPYKIFEKEVRSPDKSSLGEPYFPWKKLINYAWQIVVFFLAYELLISIDLYLVKGILRDDYLTGIYNASLTIGRLPYYIFYALTIILLPVISKSTYENNYAETSRIITRTLRLMLILLVPCVILMSVFAEPLIRLFYSERYIDAAYPMSILVWGVGFLTIFYVFCFVMSGAGRVIKPMIISIIGLLVNTILNYSFIQEYGIAGSAMATSITSALITFIMLYHIWKDFGVKIYLKSFLKIALSGTLMYLISFTFIPHQNLFILWSFLLLALYFLILYSLGEIKKEDQVFFRGMFFRGR
jgi:stage V sporulation protein B